jgi:hypothetical protein
VEFAVRPYEPADRPFVEASWTRGAHGAPSARKLPAAFWAPAQAVHVARCLASATTLVAADLEDLSTLVGWVSAEPLDSALIVHWLYVPRLLRRCGLGGKLLAGAALACGLPEVRRIVATQESKHEGWLREVAKRRGLELVLEPGAGTRAAA